MDPKFAVFVGRMCPIHIGHTRVINEMVDDFGVHNCLVILGSCATPLEWRVLFDYSTRKRWVKRIIPKGVRIIGMPDLPHNDDGWMELLEDYIKASFECDMSQVVFFGGSSEDIEIFDRYGHRIYNCERDGERYVSATNVRRLLLNGEPIDTLVDPRIVKEVVEIFNKNNNRLDKLR